MNREIESKITDFAGEYVYDKNGHLFSNNNDEAPNAYKCAIEAAHFGYSLGVEYGAYVTPKEMLPTNFTHVLIWTNISIAPTMAYYGNSDWLYFANSENFWLSKQPHIEVLAWMSIPGSPEQLFQLFKQSLKSQTDARPL